ncbi:MAG: Holliday junction branch migration DNA helicase RuvB [Candidatus Kaiserbacteria bacterium]|nr:Holliday junction branch migration DNA helicase RuvB [Candidatus Kaiserbacteria bacterium]
MSTSQETPLEHSLDSLLRPKTWDDYIGQEKVKKNLDVLISAAKQRGQMPEHILLYGPAGLGKTTLAYIIGSILGVPIQTASGPMIERVGDIASLASTLENGGVLFIDEIHRLKKNIEESLYPIMESGTVSVMLGKGPAAQSVTFDLPPIVIIAATTQAGKLSTPLRTRFSGGTLKLAPYSDGEIAQILKRSAAVLETSPPDDEAVREIAKRSRNTPRIANYLLKRVRDYAQVHEKDISADIVKQALTERDIDAYGLTNEDRSVLETINTVFNGGPVGIKALATTLSEDPETIEEVYEPFLIQVGFLDRTPRGRSITKKGVSYLRSVR